MARTNLATKTAEISYDDAWRVIERDYWDDVRGIVEDLEERIKSREVTEDDLNDALHESCDGHQSIIYTHQARVGLCCTDNADAYEDEMGEKPPTVEAQMYMALQADVLHRLGDIEWPEEVDDDE